MLKGYPGTNIIKSGNIGTRQKGYFMKQKIIILFAKPWSIVDESTKEKKEGCSLHYITTDSLAPYTSDDGSSYGFQPAKQSVSLETAGKLQAVPGLYDATFEIAQSQGKVILKVADFDFISEVEKPKK